MFVYDFNENSYPGQEPKERGYWRDVGNIDAYYQANMDLVGVDPVFNLYNDRWPIYTQSRHLTAGQVRLQRRGQRTGGLRHRLPGLRGVHHLRRTRRSGASSAPRSGCNSYTEVSECILFENVNIGRHCKIRRAIIDKNVEIPAGTTIGYDPRPRTACASTSPPTAWWSSPRA